MNYITLIVTQEIKTHAHINDNNSTNNNRPNRKSLTSLICCMG